MPFEHTYTITPSGVYEQPVETLLGYLTPRESFSDFRLPWAGDRFLALDGRVRDFNPTYRYGGPRLIVTTRTQRRFVFTETGEVAIPAPGQSYLSDPNPTAPCVAFGREGAVYAKPYPILTFETSALPE